MKKIFIPVSLIISLIACDKNEDKKVDTSLIGEWALTEVLVDPGDGSGTFHAVESNKIVDFKEDGTITSNGAICDMSTESDESTSGTYSLVDSTINASGCTDLGIKVRFEMQGGDLIINYPCIEPCRAKFRKK